MPGTVRLPGMGEVSRRTLLIGGGAAVAVMGLLWWRHRQQAQAAAAAPVDTDPNALDALDSSLLDDGTGAGTAGGGSSGAGVVSPAAITSNPQWTAAVREVLTADVVDQAQLSSALGAYLTGQAVTAAQEDLIHQAIAVEGYPPVSGPNGYPPAIREQPAGGQNPGGGVTGTHTVTATRKEQPGNSGSIPYSTPGNSWTNIIKAHYTVPNGDFTTFGSELAHANGLSGASNPKGVHMHLPQHLTHTYTGG